MQLTLDKQVEQQQAFTETIEYTVTNADARAKTVATECSSSLEAFQQQMVTFVKCIEETTQREELKNERN
jgi:hypothetical protein